MPEAPLVISFKELVEVWRWVGENPWGEVFMVVDFSSFSWFLMVLNQTDHVCKRIPFFERLIEFHLLQFSASRPPRDVPELRARLPLSASIPGVFEILSDEYF